MASKVPFEIWMEIAQLLPLRELQRLFTVSRPFFYAAMDARYREVALLHWNWSTTKTLRILERLRQSHIAFRIRCVIVDLSPRYKNNFLAALELLTPMTNTLVSLPEVTRCDLVWNHSPQSMHIMSALWPSVGSNLQTLRLVSSLQNIHSLLQSTSVHFPALKKVQVEYRQLKHSTRDKALLAPIIPFLNSHSSTLLSITFSWLSDFDCLPLVELSYLFDALGYFPGLEHLGMYIGYFFGTHFQMSMPGVVARFLSNHAETLQSMAIQLVTLRRHSADRPQLLESNDIARSLFNVPLPNMRRLDIINNITDSLRFHSKDAILETIPCFSDTLTALTLDTVSMNSAFTYEEVQKLVSSFSHRSTDTRLKNLFLPVDIISPELLDSLAFGLSSLVQLTLRVNTLVPHRSSQHSFLVDSGRIPREVLERFRKEMQKRVYNRWALRHLDIQSLRSWMAFPSIRDIIVRRISNLQRMRKGFNPIPQ